MIFHRGAKQKLCLRNAEILWNMLLLWPKFKPQGKHWPSNFDGQLSNILFRLQASSSKIFIIFITCNIPTFMSLSDKKSVVCETCYHCHILRKKERIKTVPILTRLPSTVLSWGDLNWLNGWGRENVFWCRLLGWLYEKKGRWEILKL